MLTVTGPNQGHVPNSAAKLRENIRKTLCIEKEAVSLRPLNQFS
jgi:hypothetical protein